MKLDLRTRCKRCRKIPRGKMQEASYRVYQPFCSYNCQEWFNLEEAQRYLNSRYAASNARQEDK